MRVASVIASNIVAVLILSLPPARAQDNGPAQTLFESANHERTAHGLAPLKWSATLAGAARQHALRMAARNTLSHQLPGEPGMADRASQAGARFSSLAENIAEGPSAEGIHKQWMNSPPHRANLLDAQLDSARCATRFGGDWSGRTQRRLVRRGGFLAGGGKAIRGRARRNRRRATPIARAATIELYQRRAPVLRPG